MPGKSSVPWAWAIFPVFSQFIYKQKIQILDDWLKINSLKSLRKWEYSEPPPSSLIVFNTGKINDPHPFSFSICLLHLTVSHTRQFETALIACVILKICLKISLYLSFPPSQHDSLAISLKPTLSPCNYNF